jgi:uncharacterized membrane protein
MIQVIIIHFYLKQRGHLTLSLAILTFIIFLEYSLSNSFFLNQKFSDESKDNGMIYILIYILTISYFISSTLISILIYWIATILIKPKASRSL